MNIAWPVPPENRELLDLLGFEWFGHHGRFAVAYLRHGPVAIAEHFVIHPELRNGRYVHVAFNDFVEHLHSVGVMWGIAYAPKMAPMWRRMGMTETEPGWLQVRTG